MPRMNLLPVAIAAAVVAAAVLLEGQLKWLTIGLSLLIVGLLLKFQDARGRDDDAHG